MLHWLEIRVISPVPRIYHLYHFNDRISTYLVLSALELHTGYPETTNAIDNKHYENLPMQYTEMFFRIKNGKFYWGKNDNFKRFAQNIDCGYTLEPPRRIYVLEQK